MATAWTGAHMLSITVDAAPSDDTRLSKKLKQSESSNSASPAINSASLAINSASPPINSASPPINSASPPINSKINFTHKFVQHQRRMVNLETEVEPLLRSYPGVRSAIALGWKQRIIAFVTPDTVSASKLQQQLQYQAEPSVVPDLVFALENLPLAAGGGVVDFETLLSTTVYSCLQKGEGFGCLYCDKSFRTEARAMRHLRDHTGPFFICSVPDCRAHIGEFRMSRKLLHSHMHRHKKQGYPGLKDLPGNLQPRIPDVDDNWVRTPQEIQDHIAKLLAQRVRPNAIRDDNETLPIVDMELSLEESNRCEWYSMLKQQATSLTESGATRPTSITRERQAEVLS
ncbi:hypothetical protein QBC33DRAFT_54156 [Phialemonium atrogriseum]|uniref:C2H2-type domain-containing protein n=1 Tax=Phialemonium atrogriseum TaxID=1093897 RepID=A0AAJ0FLT3_9PEZI|nr:uncharacterized protein QBC33DRAFT_54156 [Phialemonium atrogriseum]KAK1767683.1 hypothetical protein QBC33DRAFT_54156 [Phialemonium atrogriseum]